KLQKIALAGGPPQVLADFGNSSNAPYQTWGLDDNILIGISGALLRIPTAGGKPQTLATADPKKNETWLGGPQLLPGGKEVLVGIRRPGGSSDIAALNLETGTR